MATLEAAVRRVVEAGLLGEELSIVWHAGEPPGGAARRYAEAFARVRDIIPSSIPRRAQRSDQRDAGRPGLVRLHHRAQGIRVGVSVDGPAFLHDAARHTRRGDGTHTQAMRGIMRLQEAGIPIHAICVLSRASLDHPDEIYDFFVDAGILEVGFNIEERDGVNTVSTLDGDEARPSLRALLRTHRRPLPRGSRPNARARDRPGGRCPARPEVRLLSAQRPECPLRNRSVAWDGALSTFSPELLGTSHPSIRRVCLRQRPRLAVCADIAQDLRLRRITKEIARGIRRCRRSCPYFSFCRGGAPANKLSELGRFDGTITLFCQMTQMVVVETVLRALETDLGPSAELRGHSVTGRPEDAPAGSLPLVKISEGVESSEHF